MSAGTSQIDDEVDGPFAPAAFIARFPRFELVGDTRWSVGKIRGPRALPVRILGTA
jgi:hypothetical protein